MKTLVKQKDELVALLEKANVKVPYYVAPKALSFIVTVHDSEKSPNDANGDQLADSNASPTKHNSVECDSQTIGKVAGDTSKPPINSNAADVNKANGSAAHASSEQNQTKTLHILPDEGEIKKFGSVDVIAVANGSQLEPKPHEQPVKNSVQITPVTTVLTDASALLPLIDENTLHVTNTSEPTPPSTRGNVTVSVQLTKTTENGSSKPGQSNTRCLAPTNIPATDSTAIAKVNGKRCTTDVHETSDIRVSANDNTYGIDKQREMEPTVYHSVESKLMTFIDDKSSMVHSNAASDKPSAVKNLPKLSLDNILSAKTPMDLPMKALHMVATNNNDATATNDSEKDLDDELFESFRLAQTPNESNPNALSPTAAFLLSFPVVSTTLCAKPTETDNTFTGTTNLSRLDEKPSQPKENSLLESISSFDFTFNDLNDVADGKHISNQDIGDEGQFGYAVVKSRNMDLADDTSRSKHKRSYESHGKHINPVQANNENNKNEKNIQILGDTKLANLEPRKPSYTSDFLAASSSHDYPSYTKQYTTLTKPSDSMSAALPTGNFYSSLSSLGLPTKPLIPTTPAIPPVTTHFNFQKMSTLTQSQPSIADSRPADPPQFNFSLPKPTDNAYTTKSQPSTDSTPPITNRADNRTSKKSTHVKHSVSERLTTHAESTAPPLPRCTAYNPFAYDNPSVLSTSSSLTLGTLMTTPSSTMTSISTPFSFTLTPSYTSMSTTTPMLSNQEPLFASTFDMGPLLGPTCTQVKPVIKKEKHTSAASTMTVHGGKDPINSSRSVRHSTATAATTKPIKNHVNWMTSAVPSKSSHDVDLSTNPFSTSTEETTAWSANRFIDSTSLNSFNTLPQLQGDLSLNTMPSTFSNSISNSSYRNDVDTDNKKHLPGRTISPQKSSNSSRAYKSRAEPVHAPKYGKSDRPHNSFHNFPATVSNANTIRSSGDGQTINNFHSVSQLVDTPERQINTKSDTFYPMADDKMHMTKDVPYHSMKPKLADKLMATTASVCNVGPSEYNANELDRDVGAGNYLFNASKRLKLNYAPCSEPYLPSNQNLVNYETVTATSDIQSAYGNYQSYEQECITSTGSFTSNNLGNQTFTNQYGQVQPYHQQQQQFHIPQATCDTIEPLLSQNYFQASGPLSSYKPTGSNDHTPRNTTVTSKATTNHSNYGPMNMATSKSNQNEPQTKTSSTISNLGHSINHSIQALNGKSSHRTTNVTKSAHYMTAVATPSLPPPPPSLPSVAAISTVSSANNFNNINNIGLNQPWNDSFSWMPYSNHTYNSQLFTNESNTMKPNHSTTNTNTIPNFNLTTIFPDCNKS